MKLKIGNIIDINTAVDLHPALLRFANMDLPVKTSFRLKGIVKQAIDHFNNYAEHRLGLYKKHGEHNTETDQYTVLDANLTAFRVEFQQLLDTDIEITGDRFKLSEFYSSSSIRTNDLLALEWLIDDGQPAPLALVHNTEPEPADCPDRNDGADDDILSLDEQRSQTATA